MASPARSHLFQEEITMKLPPDYVIPSFGDLKRGVVLMATGAEKWDEPLEMTKEQYLRYKELVWDGLRREDPIRFYNGMEIRIDPPFKHGLMGKLSKLSTEDAIKTGGGSV